MSAGLLLLPLLVVGCRSHRPPIAEILLDTDLPMLSEEPLPLLLTLDVGTGAKDLLDPNLLVNAGFEMAPPLKDCAYDRKRGEVITPNGFRISYPLPEELFGWGGRSGEVVLMEGRTFYRASSHYLSMRPKDSDTVPCRLFATGYPLEVSEGERYRLEAFVSSDLARLRVMLVSDTLAARPLSHPVEVVGDRYWSRRTATLTVTADADSAYLMLEALPLAEGDTIFPHLRPRGYLALDELRLLPDVEAKELSEPLPQQLLTLLKRLEPEYVRFPGGRTANGYYPGSYPTPHYGRPDTLSLRTLAGGEYTGHFGLPALLRVAEILGAKPILVANAGITDPTARPRYEEAKRVPERAEELELLAAKPGLMLQAGYDFSSPEYRRRFDLFARRLDPERLIAAGPLVDSVITFSDYLYDLALTDIREPHLPKQLPEANRSLQSRRQPLMISEATFAPTDQLPVFVPPLCLRAAFLVEAERQTPLLEGIGIAPLLSSDPADCPLVLVRGAHYRPTMLYEMLYEMRQKRGNRLLHTVEREELSFSVTTDDEGRHYYLKAVNLTRHPLSYSIRMKGRRLSAIRSVEVTRFGPTVSTTTDDLSAFDSYSVRTNTLSLTAGSKSFDLTLAPFEVVIAEIIL